MTSDIPHSNPLYAELAESLRSNIESGVYAPGDRMPSEPTLCETTGYSRSTVRKALQLLVDEGYITKSQGKGTFVAERTAQLEAATQPNADAMPLFMSFTENVRTLGGVPVTRTVDIRTVHPTPGLAEFFGIDVDSEVFEATRLRLVDDDPVMLETIWLPMTYGDLTGEELDGSLYACLKARYGVEPGGGSRSIGICYATSRESFQLGVDKDSALMLLEDHVYDQTGAPLHVSKQVTRGDKYQFSLRMPAVPA